MSGSSLSDARLAAAVAAEAGELLLRRRAESGLTGKDLGKLGDHDSNELILGRLAAARPGDAVLSEESADDPARLAAPRVWIVDPLDGTREYGLAGRDDWAVHVALWEASAAGGAITAAAVAQPSLASVWATDDGLRDRRRTTWAAEGRTSTATTAEGDTAAQVVLRRGLTPQGSAGASPVVLVSDSRPPAFAAEVAAAVGGTVEPMGSAGAKAMAVLRGRAAAYVHAGGQWEWDSAAPVGVLMAAGFHCSRIDGSPLLYNQAHPYLPDLLICRPELADPLLAALSPYVAPGY